MSDPNAFLHVVKEPYWYGRCRKCGFTASTEFFREFRTFDDSDVRCPLCGCSRIDEAPAPPADRPAELP